MTSSPNPRLVLIRDLNALAQPDFEALLSALNVPPGTISSGMAQQGIRSTQLLDWVEGPIGCGMDQLLKVLEELPSIPASEPTPLHYGWDSFGSSTFVGRREELEALHQKLTQSGQVAIAATAGMGGVGKTALAREYVRQQEEQNTYPGGVWWLSVRELGMVSAVQGAAIVPSSP